MVWLLPPGITSVACTPEGTVPPTSSSATALLRLVDPDALYVPVPGNLDCRGGGSKSYGLTVPLGFGGRTDPLQVVRERLTGLRPGDGLERAGYPEETYPSVLVSRDGRVVALVDVGPAVSSDSSVVSACLDSGIRPDYARTPSEPSGTSPVPLEQFPHQAEIVEGGTYSVLYLAIAERGSVELDDAVSRARSYGYSPEVRRLECDVGAAETYRLPKDWLAVGVYFNRERDPWFVADAINSPHWEPSQVTTRCVD